MSQSMGVEQTLDEFVKQWKARNKNFHLDDDQVRDELMSLVAASMTVLLTCDRTQWTEFMNLCSAAAKKTVPEHIQKMIRGELVKT
jgi:hypothetical protein